MAATKVTINGKGVVLQSSNGFRVENDNEEGNIEITYSFETNTGNSVIRTFSITPENLKSGEELKEWLKSENESIEMGDLRINHFKTPLFDFEFGINQPDRENVCLTQRSADDLVDILSLYYRDIHG
jgi:hypothetical protein